MAKIHKRLFYLLFATVLLVNCAGEDGEPGPAGDQGTQGEKGDKGDKGDAGEDGIGEFVKLGTFEGKVTGTRKDGTPFEYPFSYEYTYASGNAFEMTQGKNSISIVRLTTDPWEDFAGFELEKINGTLVPHATTYSAQFDFHHELNPTTVFSLEASASFEDFEGEHRPISKVHNERYAFSSNGKNIYTSSFMDQDVYSVNGYNNNVYYSQATGLLLGINDYTTDQVLTSGALFDKYNEVKLTFDGDAGEYKFLNKETLESLHEVIPAVPADKLTITNYSHDATTGVLSFDFKLEISKYDVATRVNSTNHDLVFEGKYNSGGRVYETTVGRPKN